MQSLRFYTIFTHTIFMLSCVLVNVQICSLTRPPHDLLPFPPTHFLVHRQKLLGNKTLRVNSSPPDSCQAGRDFSLSATFSLIASVCQATLGNWAIKAF